jgi:signal transduction histidine kinase
MFTSLRSRLFLSYVAIILVCLLVAGLALLAALRIRQTQQRVTFQRLNDLAQATTIALRGKELQPAQAARVFERLGDARKVRILLLDTQGSVIFDSQEAWRGQSFLERARFKRADDGSLQGTLLDPDKRGWLFVARPTSDSSPTRMLVFATLQPRGAVLTWARDNLLVPLVWAGTAALVLSTLLALLLGRSVARPLRRVAAAAEAISQGETGRRAPVSGPSEVEALARSFNRMADQVEAAQQSQRDLVANVSHELKTPLTSIQGFSQAILDGTATEPEATARAADIIHEEAQRMRRMVDDLLILARFDAGQVEMAREPVEIGRLLRGCVETLTPQVEKADVAVEVDISGELFASGDADQLGQVFTNLIDNGVAHTPQGGRVSVAARMVPAREATHHRGHDKAPSSAEQAIQVTVTDSGEGIPAETLPRIFERFYRADKARRRRGGAGLGLAIAKEIIAALGGTLTAESVVGLGSRFTVRLPIAEEETQADVRRGRRAGV